MKYHFWICSFDGFVRHFASDTPFTLLCRCVQFFVRLVLFSSLFLSMFLFLIISIIKWWKCFDEMWPHVNLLVKLFYKLILVIALHKLVMNEMQRTSCQYCIQCDLIMFSNILCIFLIVWKYSFEKPNYVETKSWFKICAIRKESTVLKPFVGIRFFRQHCIPQLYTSYWFLFHWTKKHTATSIGFRFQKKKSLISSQ